MTYLLKEDVRDPDVVAKWLAPWDSGLSVCIFTVIFRTDVARGRAGMGNDALTNVRI